jgi:CheY-like chemotaxis protein
MFRILAIDDKPHSIRGSLEALRGDGRDVVSAVDAATAEGYLRVGQR